MIGEEEIAAVVEVLKGPQLVHGPRAKAFEAKFADFCGGGSATSVSSCTAGLHLSYFDLGIGAGDEVIVPAQSHVATAHAVELTGARCVFVDVDPKTGNIDVEAAASAVTERTRAITLVHYLGLPADMDGVMALANRHNLPVVEDCALAVGSRHRGRHCGLIGHVGCFSFYPVKHFTTAEGGMVLAQDADVIARLARKKAFGVDRTVSERKVPGVYDVTMLGFNYRMNELAAAIGIVQLDRINGFLERRRAYAKILRAGLAEIDEISLLWEGDADHEHSEYCIAAILDEKTAARRLEIVQHLNAAGVGTSIYYPKAIPEMTYYRDKYGHAPTDFPHARRISDHSIALSVGPHLAEEDMEYTIGATKNALQETR